MSDQESDLDPRVGELIAAYLKFVEEGRTADVARQLALVGREELTPFLDRFIMRDRTVRGRVPPIQAIPGEDDRTLPAGTMIGRFKLLERLGGGGMGVVYKAQQNDPDREVALKILWPHRDWKAASPDEMKARFRAEVQAVATLQHANIVRIYESGDEKDRLYYTMEFVEGSTLSGRFEDFKKDPKDLARLTITLARAVHHAHVRGFIHRDLKPDNILISPDGQPHITDFGLAKRLGHGKSLTLPGNALGTLQYMAPEQLSSTSDKLTTAIDTYALGVILYQLLTGKLPFEGNTEEILRKILEEEPPPIQGSNPQIDRDLEIICLKCLQKDPTRRYATSLELAEDLERWLNGQAIRAHPPSVIYRFRKFLARRKAVVIPVTTALMLALAFAIWGLSRYKAEESRIATLKERQRLEQEAKNELAGLWTQVVLAKQGIYKKFLRPQNVRQELAKTIAEISRFIGDHQDDHEAYCVRAHANYYLGDLKEAEKDLKQVFAKAKSDFTPAWALRARMLLEEHQQALYGFVDPETSQRKAAPLLEQAKAALSKAQSDDRTLFRTGEDKVMRTLMQALTNYFLDKREEEAVHQLERASGQEQSEEYWFWIAAWAQDNQKEKCLGLAIEVAPNHYRGYLDRGNFRLSRGELKSAEADLKKAIEIAPANTVAHSNLGFLCIKLGDLHISERKPDDAIKQFDDAIRHCKEALKNDDGYLPALLTCGTAYHKKFKVTQVSDYLKEAENYFEKAVKISADCVTGWRNLGVVRCDAKTFEEAIFALEKARQIPPESSKTLNLLGGIYYNWGCDYAVKAKQTSREEQERLLSQAMDKLREARSYRFFEQPGMKEHATKDRELELLWFREEFRKLINEPRP